MAVGDLNGDGRPDLVVTDQSDNMFAVLMNSPALISTGSSTATIAGEFRPVNETINEYAGTFSLPVAIPQAATDTAVSITVSGTAISGINFGNLTANPLIIPAGQTTGTITGTLFDDGQYDAVDKTLVLTLGAPVNIRETITIHETDPQPMAAFTNGSESIDENTGAFSVPVKLSAASKLDTTIPFTLGGTAVAGVDYTGLAAGSIVIPAGQRTGMIHGTLVDDGITNPFFSEPTKTLTFTLGTPTNGTLGVNATNTLNITEPPNHLVFANLGSTNIVAGGTVTFGISELDSSGQPVTTYIAALQITSSDPNASTGGNYLPQTVDIMSGANGTGVFTVTLTTAGMQTITVADLRVT